MSLRLALYSHNLYGLGHIMRSFRLANAALDDGGFSCALITGCRALKDLTVPSGAELLELRPAQRIRSFRYAAWDDPSDIAVIPQRAEQILKFCRKWKPDIMLIDHAPLGMAAELMATLCAAVEEQWPTRFYFGCPYREGDPTSQPKYRNPRIKKALSSYHGIIAYLDSEWSSILDGMERFPNASLKEYAGFVTVPPTPSDTDPAESNLATVLCGGGHEAEAFCQSILAASQERRAAAELRLRMVTGPLETPVDFSGEAGVEVQRTGAAEELTSDSRVIICRSGYNTSLTVVQGQCPVILVPLTTPDREQFNRAVKLAEMDRVWWLDENSPLHGDNLSQALGCALAAPVKPRSLNFRPDGAQRAVEILKRWQKTAP